MSKASGPFLAIYGDESLYVDRAIESLRNKWAKQDRIVTLLDGEHTSESEFLNLCSTQSFFEDDLRAIVLDNAQEIKFSKQLDAFVSARDAKDLSTLIVMVFRSNTLPKNVAEASKKGTCEQFSRLKPWETEKLFKRITAEAKLLGLDLDDGIPELFHYALGDNLRSIVNELQKIKYLVGNRTNVSKKDVTLILATDKPVEPWQVAEAAIAKNPTLAMNLLALVHQSLGDNFIVPVTIGLQRQVEKILVVRQMLDKGDSLSTIAAAMDKSEFFCQKNIIPVAQKHSLPNLVKYMQDLCQLEVRVKGLARSKKTLVELAILKIATQP